MTRLSAERLKQIREYSKRDSAPALVFQELLHEIDALREEAKEPSVYTLEIERANREVRAECEALRAEVEEQCRLNGMGAQRELRLITERDRLAEECKQWSDRNLELVAERDRLRELLVQAAKVLNRIDQDTRNESVIGCPGCTCNQCIMCNQIASEALAKIWEGLK